MWKGHIEFVCEISKYHFAAALGYQIMYDNQLCGSTKDGVPVDGNYPGPPRFQGRQRALLGLSREA